MAVISVNFVTHQGVRTHCTADVGMTLMAAALVNGIDGVLAECGGSLACGTCHVIVDPAYSPLLSPPTVEEDSMLDMTAATRQLHSRLSCQIALTEALDGLVVHLPDRQI